MQIKSNFQKYSTSNKIFAIKLNGQIFTIKTSFQPLAEVFSTYLAAVGCYILLYVVCHCVICVVDCGAYVGSEDHTHELDMYCTHNLTRKCTHRNMTW